MHNFHIKLLFHIIGIGSASGLHYKDDKVFIIADNGGYLYEYSTINKMLSTIPLLDSDTLVNIPKTIKPDFEALAAFEDKLYVFGSGSTSNRNSTVTVDKTTKTITTEDLTDLYLTMQSFAELSPSDFNIEGVAYNGKDWFFFQRGNGKKGKNGIFTVSGNNLQNDFAMVYNEYRLPKINGVRASFTDAVIVGDQIYFLATAEDTASTYFDGKVMGSLVGKIDIEKMKVTSTLKISDTHKFEGITLYSQSDANLTFLLCEDNDTDLQESDIFSLELKR